MNRALLMIALLVASSCKSKTEAPPKPPEQGSGSAGAGQPTETTFDRITRPELNRWAVRLNLPVYWIADTDNDNTIDPDEVADLLFYPTKGHWVDGGKLTAELTAAYEQIVAASKAPPPDASSEEGKRQKLVGEDLDQGRATLVLSNLAELSADDKAFVGHMLEVAALVDALYELQNGSAALAAKLPNDPASRSLFRRNRGPKCVGPATETDPLCSAIPGSPKPIFDLYPAELQSDPKFCAALEKINKQLVHDHFSVVRGTGGQLKSVPYTEAYRGQMTAISNELMAAADSIKDPSETALVAYLKAASASFKSNDWEPANEAWAKMNVDNSKWYVRVAPDETYWEPCAQKAGLEVSFARINQASKEWQGKLAAVQQQMEDAVATYAGSPYKARKVTFHLPDFIDIVINAGDARDPLGATIGQSLPNWGPVANEGRGRTVAMTNINTDADSMAARRSQAESMFDAASIKLYAGTTEPGLVSTILHEAMHNLGPAHEYKVAGKKAPEVFGGPLAQVMEELKAQTGALYLFEFLRGKGVISDELAAQGRVDSLVWALGHISQGMYTGSGGRKTYSNLAAIQIGLLLEKGALSWDANATAANGKDKGALTVHVDKLGPAIDEMMKLVAGIKARGDAKAANELSAKYVDSSTVVPHKIIQERFQRFAKASFVYSVKI
ncbi:MAG: hypothetical protein AB7O24_29855 [Kofleriaceae bacterium]